MFEKEAEEYGHEHCCDSCKNLQSRYRKVFRDGAEFGYKKAKEEMQEQDYSLVDFVMQYENGKYKCKYKSGKEFESVDGETWKEIVPSKCPYFLRCELEEGKNNA